jgi:dynein heavy chain
MELVD